MVEQCVGHPYPFLLNCTHISIAVDYQERRHKESLRLRSLITPRFQRQYRGLHYLYSVLN